jgi:hypothetical protein
MKQIDGPYFPTHDKCGKKQNRLTGEQSSNLLTAGHVTLYCNDCREPWLFTPPAKDVANLRRLSD